MEREFSKQSRPRSTSTQTVRNHKFDQEKSYITATSRRRRSNVPIHRPQRMASDSLYTGPWNERANCRIVGKLSTTGWNHWCFPGRFSTTKIGVRSHLPSYRRNISSHRRTCHVPSGEPIANLDLAGNRRDWIMVVFADTTIRNYESCIVHQKRCGYSLGGYANVHRWWNVNIPCFSRLHP